MKRLSQALLNYKSPQQGEASTKKLLLDPQNPKKWGGVINVHPLIVNEVIFKLSEILNLDEMQTFDLLDTYFITNEDTQKQLAVLNKFAESIDNINMSMQNLVVLPQANIYQQQKAQQQLKERYTAEFFSTANQILSEAQNVYFEERIKLIDSIFLVLEIQLKNPRVTYGQTLIQNKVSDNLIQSLEENARKFEEWMRLKDQRKTIIHLQREEIQIIKCLFQLYRHHQIPTVQEIIRFMKYQISNNFMGFVSRHLKMIIAFQSDGDVRAQQTILSELAILTSLIMLQVHLFAEQDLERSDKAKQFINQLLQQSDSFKQLQQLFDDLHLTNMNSIVYLAYRQIMLIIKELDLPRKFGLPQDKANLINQINLNNKTQELAQMQFIDQIIEINQTHKYFEDDHSDKRGELNFLIQDWLNLVYPYLLENRMHSERAKSQTLAFNILKQPIHLKSIWQLIERSETKLIGVNVDRQKKLRYHTLDIFEDIMRDPIEHFGNFCLIMTNLCGDKEHRYENKVAKLLKQYSGLDLPNNQFRDNNILQILLLKFVTLTTYLENDSLSQLDFNQYINLTFLIGKLIYQNPLLYEDFNDLYLHSTISSQQQQVDFANKRLLRGKQDMRSYEANEPILQMIIRSLHSLFKQDIEIVQYAAKSLIKALGSIYDKLNLQTEILMHLQFCFDDNRNQYEFIQYFQSAIDNYELQVSRYKTTEVILKFMNKIFKKNYPQGFIEDEHRINLQQTFISRLLYDVYQPLISNYFQLNFSLVSDLASFSYRLLKLTNTLLSKYKDINPTFKAPISHMLPQFDPLLHILNDIFNQTPIENIITQVLLLDEGVIDNVQTGLQNKFWLQQLQLRLTDSRKSKHFINMIDQALRCYNTILELGLVYTQAQNLSVADKYQQIGTRAYYLLNLGCVQNVSLFVQTPGMGPQFMINQIGGSTVSYSIFNIIQYYVKPSLSLTKFIMDINIQAVKFMVNCANIWAVPSQRLYVNLESILRYSGVSPRDVRSQYVLNFQEAVVTLNKPLSLQYLNTFIDLLIIAASSQQSFLDDLLKDQTFKQALIDLITIKLAQQNVNDVMNCLVTDIKCKVVILLSEMSSNRSGTDLLGNLADNNNIKGLYTNIIQKLVPIIKRRVSIDYVYHMNQDMGMQLDMLKKNTKSTQEVYQVCQALITIKYYFKLLSSEYSRNIDNQNIREAICALFQDQALMSDLHLMFNKGDELHQELQLINESLSKDSTLYNRDFARSYIKTVEMSHQINNEHISFMENSKLRLDDIAIFINQLDGTNLNSYLMTQSNIPYLLQQDSFNDNHNSKIGSQLMINTEELYDILRNYYFVDEQMISHIIVTTSRYNMMLSYFYSFNCFTESIKQFILTVGKIRARESMRNRDFVLNDKVLNTSLFVLADAKDPKEYINNQDVIKGVQSKLIKSMTIIAKSLIQTLTTRHHVQISGSDFSSSDILRSVFELRQLDTDIELSALVLGVVNNLSTIAPISQDNLKQLEAVKQLVKVLPSIRLLQQSFINQGEQGQAQKTIQEQTAAKNYVHLVLQTLSIINLINEGQSEVERQRSTMIVKDANYDIELIHIISSVVKLMSERDCFLEGLQILEMSVNLLMPDNIKLFFKRQENSPLKLIVQRLVNPGTPSQEGIRIVEFLIKFAQSENGAEILNQENVLHNISISSIINKVNQQDLYIQEGDYKRNPVHILWCQVLIFIRAMNSQLITDFSYKKNISAQLRLFESRVISVLDVGAVIKNSTDDMFIKTALSLALFEELDLITGALQQIFENIDMLDGNDFRIYEQIKDRYLFSVVHLFAIDTKIKQASATEQFFNSMTLDNLKENIANPANSVIDRDSYSGFDLLVNVEKIKIFLNMNSTLVNLLILNQSQMSDRDLINTWDRQLLGDRQRGTATPRRGGDWDAYSLSHSTYTHQTFLNPTVDFDEFLGLNYLTSSVYNYISALNQMNKLFSFWRSNEATLSDFYRDTIAYFNHDEWINFEYQGLNTFLGASSFKETMEQFETAMQMGYLASSLILQSLVELHKDKENSLGGRITVSLKDLMDYGDNIKRLYSEFLLETKSSKIVKPSVENFGTILQEVVENIKRSPHFEERLY